MIFLTVLAGLTLSAVPRVIAIAGAGRAFIFLGSVAVGSGLAHILIKDHLSVFIHELKHSIVSNLAGNRAKGMEIKRNTGHFEYEYTKKTAAYNAFIFLAPYYFPLTSIVALGLSALFIWGEPLPLLFVIGASVGVDLELGLRDIGPHQTDFTSLRGGYVIGLYYVTVMNLVIWSLLLTVALEREQGLILLGNTLWEWGFNLYSTLRQL